MPNSTQDLMSLNEILKEETNIKNLHVYVKVETSGYHDIGKGYRVALVLNEEDGALTAKDMEGKLMISLADSILTIRQLSTNPYEGDFLKEYDVTDKANKAQKEDFIDAVKVVTYKMYSFGGEQPYVRLLDSIFVGLAPSEPIGEAIIGDTLVVQ